MGAWKVIDSMDILIKDYVDSMYEQSFVESAVSTRADTTNFLRQRTTKRSVKAPFGGNETNAIIKFQVQHIERCMAARLESYQRAYEEAGRVPTQPEITEILEDVNNGGKVQEKNSMSFIDNFFRARRSPGESDPAQNFRVRSAHRAR